MHEKRTSPRVPLRIEVVCTTEGGARLVGHTRDLSVGGAFIEAPEVPAFGSKVSVVLVAPETQGFTFPGIVRWTKPDGFGLQFQLLGARETHAVASLTRRG